MNRILSLMLVVMGVSLIVYGGVAMDSFGSDVSRALTGSPTDKSIWMLIVGFVIALVGLSGATLSVRASKA